MSTHGGHRCSDLGDLLSAYADHEATPAEMTLVEAHARTCAACAVRLQRYVRLASRVDADVRSLLSLGEAASRDMKPVRFHSRLTTGSSGPRLVSRLATVAMLVAIGLVVAFVLLRSVPVVQPPLDTAAQPGVGNASAPTQAPGSPVVVVSIDGLVDPAVATYLDRAVAVAEGRHAAGLVVVLNASGGLDGPLHHVADDLTSSSVPTLAYIGPGANNAANAVLAQASDVRAAAPAPNLDAVLRGVDGREALTPSGVVVLNTADSPLQTLEMEPLEAAAHRLMDPTTAYLLLILGLYAVFVEVAHPGALLPGTTGLVCLALASVGLTVLPTNWLGLGVLVVAVGLIGLELKASTHGALVVAGVASLVVGSVLLYSAPGTVSPVDTTDVTVAPAVWIGTAIAGLVLGLLVARIAARIHRLPPVLSLEQLIGAAGVARSGLAPEGVVQVHGQLWSARLRGGQLESGQPIRVIARHGLVLEVESTAPGGAATRKGAFR